MLLKSSWSFSRKTIIPDNYTAIIQDNSSGSKKSLNQCKGALSNQDWLFCSMMGALRQAKKAAFTKEFAQTVV